MAGWVRDPDESAGDRSDLPASQPPSPPAWTAPPQQQWQGWPQASEWAAPAPFGSSRLAYMAAVVLLVVGVLVGAFGLLAIVFGMIVAGFASNSSDMGAAGTLVFPVGPLALLLGVVEMVSSIGIGFHQSWARWLGIALGLVGVVGSIWVQISFPLVFEFFGLTAAQAMLVTIAMLATHGFVVAALIAAGAHFRPRAPQG